MDCESEKLSAPGLAVIAIVRCAIGLVIVPEVIYVKDIYGEEYARFNTMFKLTYQAFILLGICIGIAAGFWRKTGKRIVVLAITAITVLLASYSCVAVKQQMGNIFKWENRSGCSALKPLYEDTELLPEASAVHILGEDNRNNLHIIEGFGESYSPDCKLSVFSGACTIVGWNVHEWMWHDNWDIVSERDGEVFNFYTMGDSEYCREIINKYHVDYIFVGPREYEKYVVMTEGFEEFCEKIPVSEDLQYALYKVIR